MAHIFSSSILIVITEECKCRKQIVCQRSSRIKVNYFVLFCVIYHQYQQHLILITMTCSFSQCRKCIMPGPYYTLHEHAMHKIDKY